MTLHDLLFVSGDLRASLKAQAGKVVAEVNAAPVEHLRDVDEDGWVAALVERWSVEAPVLHVERMWQDEAKEVQVDVRGYANRAIFDYDRPAWFPGYRIKVHIPFSGEADVFKLRASTFSYNPPRAEIGRGELTETIEYPTDSPVDIAAHASELAGKVNQHLSWARGDIDEFNRNLEQTARQAILARRQRVEAHEAHIARTGLPVGPPDQSAKTFITDALVRRPAPVLPSLREDQPVPLEPVLADEVFEDILSIIRSAGLAMERSPATYVGMGEEDRRQVLLLALNTQYQGRAVAEAFNVAGKTDILVRHENQNLFIGECKFWSGAKGFIATVDQLFGYRAWRDTKLAIVMFVRERDLTAIIEKGREALAAHPQFVEWKTPASETELRASVSWPGDDRRHADLVVFFVSTPA